VLAHLWDRFHVCFFGVHATIPHGRFTRINANQSEVFVTSVGYEHSDKLPGIIVGDTELVIAFESHSWLGRVPGEGDYFAFSPLYSPDYEISEAGQLPSAGEIESHGAANSRLTSTDSVTANRCMSLVTPYPSSARRSSVAALRLEVGGVDRSVARE